MGWATDVAGSARIPASFNGLFALKASAGRLPTMGIASGSPALPLCNFAVAIMSWDLSIIQHVSRLCLGSHAYQEDADWLDMPWRETRFQSFRHRRPAFAILAHDGHIRPQPPVLRAIATTRTALHQQGCEIVSWDPPAHAPATEVLFRIIGADGAAGVYDNIAKSKEPPVPQLRKWFNEAKDTPSLSASEFWSLCKTRREYIRAYHNYWQASKLLISDHRDIDGVIMPVVAEAACVENALTYFGRLS